MFYGIGFLGVLGIALGIFALPVQALQAEIGCSSLAKHLEQCKRYECQEARVIAGQKLTSTYVVFGKKADGSCDYMSRIKPDAPYYRCNVKGALKEVMVRMAKRVEAGKPPMGEMPDPQKMMHPDGTPNQAAMEAFVKRNQDVMVLAEAVKQGDCRFQMPGE